MKVSVIIPTFNRSGQLQRTLQHLGHLPEDRDSFEIIVVDNGSDDDTAAFVEFFAGTFPQLDVRYFYDPVPGLLTGRHRGAAEAAGDILTFIDDDVHVSQAWLSAIIDTMTSRPEVSLMTGPCLPLYETPAPHWVDGLWRTTDTGKYCGWFSLLDFGDKPQTIDPDFVWGLNFTIRRSAFLSLGGFHPDNILPHLQVFQGDGETGLTRKAKEEGLQALYHPEARLIHEITASRLTPEYLKKRAFYQGVCNSFSQKREENSLYETILEPKMGKVDKASSWLRTKIKRLIRNAEPGNEYVDPLTAELLAMAQAEEAKGFDFHHSAYHSMPVVRDWVLRENYFNYELPVLQ